ncbi:MAG: hypothetical protein OEY86_13375 [Nitrospira sp.]|nr:hypothetical protein [Nitrospira sp.]
MIKGRVFCGAGIMVLLLVPCIVLGAEEHVQDYFWPLQPGLVLHYESDDPGDPEKVSQLRHTIRIAEIKKASGSRDVIVKTEEEFNGFGVNFAEPFEYLLLDAHSEIRQIGRGESRMMLKGPLIAGTKWPASYEVYRYVDEEFKSRRTVESSCSIVDRTTEEWLDKRTTCLWVACPMQAGRTPYKEKSCFCKELGYIGSLIEEANGKTYWQERLVSVTPPGGGGEINR